MSKFPLSQKTLQLRSIVGHGATYNLLKKYLRNILKAKTDSSFIKAGKIFQKNFFKLRDSGAIQKKFNSYVKKFKI